MDIHVKKIERIQNLAVFRDFKWNDSMRRPGNDVAYFSQRLNIMYGRNYSGKTTLSRIFRALETKTISDKYDQPEFKIEFYDHNEITHNTLNTAQFPVRVFNDDFIRENLRFLHNEDETISSFAILGEDNSRIEQEIEKLVGELGNKENRSGLIWHAWECELKHTISKRKHDAAERELDDALRDKANIEIKQNTKYENVKYNIASIKKDIQHITSPKYVEPNSDEVNQFDKILEEKPKASIDLPVFPDLILVDLTRHAKELVEKKIAMSESISELASDAILQTWVREGRKYHVERDLKECRFCGNVIPVDLWERLDKHFNKESEELYQNIETLIDRVKRVKNQYTDLDLVPYSKFYLQYQDSVKDVAKEFEDFKNQVKELLESVDAQLVARRDDIYSPKTFIDQNFDEDKYDEIIAKHKEIIEKSNNETDVLGQKQYNARLRLRLHEVSTFLQVIKYQEKVDKITLLKQDVVCELDNKKRAAAQVLDVQNKLSDLKSQLKDESKGADKVNQYLNNYFGHHAISLQAVENIDEESDARYRFDVMRGDKKAYHLSEGECSLIAFCYYVAKLSDVDTINSKPILYIDDPISSLDSNHIFFIYSIINSEIVFRKNFSQLFISTHNLDFLKYLKRLHNPGGLSGLEKNQYFMVERLQDKSNLKLMPDYLRNFVTEFNYLFHQIYVCANTNELDNENHAVFYNFANNARKFLESFLYYKYPNAVMYDDKLVRFFGDDVLATTLTDRINNEYSHCDGLFERSLTPVDIPEMKMSAKFILSKIQEHDQDQYEALLKSIGVEISEEAVQESLV